MQRKEQKTKTKINFIVHMDPKILALLEQGGMCQILVMLLDHPEGISKPEYRKPPLYLGPRAVNRDLLELYNAGLVIIVPDPVNLKHKLTEKGKEVAKRIKEIMEIMEKK